VTYVIVETKAGFSVHAYGCTAVSRLPRPVLQADEIEWAVEDACARGHRVTWCSCTTRPARSTAEQGDPIA
jgi:hypothetical protein